MNAPMKAWDGEAVRTWLASRFGAAQSDQDVADRAGRAREDDYDKAVAEAWVCRATMRHAATSDQTRFVAHLKALLDQDEYPQAGVHDERRFEREVRSYLRKLSKMAKTNTGFEKLLRYQ